VINALRRGSPVKIKCHLSLHLTLEMDKSWGGDIKARFGTEQKNYYSETSHGDQPPNLHTHHARLSG
jgi:hypothetical protein